MLFSAWWSTMKNRVLGNSFFNNFCAVWIDWLSIPLKTSSKQKVYYNDEVVILNFNPLEFPRVLLSSPGVIVSMSLVFFCINYFDYIYQTFIVLVLGYFISFLPAALGPIKASMTQIDPKLEDASLTLGASRIKTYINLILY